MQHTDLKAGNFYTAKVTGKTVTVKLLTIRSAAKYRGNNDSAATHYDVEIMDTGKKVVFRSPSRFLKEVAPPTVKEVAGKGGENSSDPTKTSRPKTRPSSGSTPKGRAKASTGASSRDTAAAESAVKSEVDRPNAAPSSVSSLDLARRLRTEAQPVQVSGQHLIVAALAGTGKTTTLVEGLKFMRGQPTAINPSPQQKAVWDAMVSSRNARFVCCCAFNKTIAEELQSRVPEGVDVMTMHSMGFRAVRRAFKDVQKDDFRVVNIIGELTNQDVRHLRNTRPVFLSSTTQLVNLVKQNLVPTDIECLEDRDGVNSCLQELADYYDVMLEDPEYGGEGNITEEVFELVPKIIDRCKEVARDNKIDFTDMIWLPIALGLPVFQYDLLLGDEVQDWNRCQQALAKKAGKRLVLCGDVNQAIYGFAGADCDSIPRLTKELSNISRGCVTLPLTVTRRCGKAIVKEAQTIVPSFEAHDSAPEGVIYRDVYDREAATAVNPHYAARAESGDMVICRVNAPLVSQCFMFLRSGRKANIIGRDIAKGLTSLINKLANPNDTVDTLVTAVEEWLEREMAKENKKKNPSDTKLIMLDDKAQCILTFCDEVTQTNGRTVSAVLARIDSIFSEPTAGVGIRLSSIHRAKGLEAHRVFLLEPKGCGVPHPMARSPWQRKQEYNLRYVALTRAINELVYVS